MTPIILGPTGRTVRHKGGDVPLLKGTSRAIWRRLQQDMARDARGVSAAWYWRAQGPEKKHDR